MKIKKGVKLLGVTAIPIALQIIEPILKKYKQELVVTSMMDGVHREDSLHYFGLAIDIRTWHISNMTACVAKIRDALGDNFDVVVESDHIHIEYDESET